MKVDSARKYLSTLRQTNRQLILQYSCRPSLSKFKRVRRLHRAYSYYSRRDIPVLIQSLNWLKMSEQSDQGDFVKTSGSSISAVDGRVTHEVVLSKIRRYHQKISRFKDVNKLSSEQSEFQRVQLGWQEFCKVEIESRNPLESENIEFLKRSFLGVDKLLETSMNSSQKQSDSM